MKEGETFFVYLFVSIEAIEAALVQENNTYHKLVYV